MISGTIESHVASALDNPYRPAGPRAIQEIMRAMPERFTVEQTRRALHRLASKGAVSIVHDGIDPEDWGDSPRPVRMYSLAMHRYELIRSGLVGWTN